LLASYGVKRIIFRFAVGGMNMKEKSLVTVIGTLHLTKNCTSFFGRPEWKAFQYCYDDGYGRFIPQKYPVGMSTGMTTSLLCTEYNLQYFFSIELSGM
jgi:hypothetical protein